MIEPNLPPEARSFVAHLQSRIDRWAMLRHPFYRLWSEGRLSRASLQSYATQYYHHVRAFPTYVSAVHARCDDLAIRRSLLQNLIEEEHGDNNHPELWLRFADGLDLPRAELEMARPLPSTAASVATFRGLTRGPDYQEGIAALYAYESQIPEVARTKREGLERFYGLINARAVSFFTAHESADVRHREVAARILAEHCRTGEARDAVVVAAETAAKALWEFLDGMLEASPEGGALACAS